MAVYGKIRFVGVVEGSVPLEFSSIGNMAAMLKYCPQCKNAEWRMFKVRHFPWNPLVRYECTACDYWVETNIKLSLFKESDEVVGKLHFDKNEVIRG